MQLYIVYTSVSFNPLNRRHACATALSLLKWCRRMCHFNDAHSSLMLVGDSSCLFVFVFDIGRLPVFCAHFHTLVAIRHCCSCRFIVHNSACFWGVRLKPDTTHRGKNVACPWFFQRAACCTAPLIIGRQVSRCIVGKNCSCTFLCFTFRTVSDTYVTATGAVRLV